VSYPGSGAPAPGGDPPATPASPRLAVVLTGGGARAAYQAGVLRGLGRHLPELRFPIITGVSAGAINAVYIAAHPEPLGRAAADLCRIWERIELDDVFRIDLGWLTRNLFRWLLRLGSGGGKLGEGARGLLDTTPLQHLFERELEAPSGKIEGIARNVEAGHLQAVSLATVNYGTGQTVSWVEGCDVDTWERPDRRARTTRLTVEHVMASSALPLLFPAVKLDGGWYGDGGIRLSAPLSPTLHLGAERIFTISPRYARSREEADRPSQQGYPPPAQIAGNLLNAIFLDVLDQDVLRLERLNRLLRKLPPEERGGLEPVELLLLRPSQDLGRLSAEYEPRLPRGFRFLTRSLGTRDTESPDALSLLMFQPGYLHRLVELGQRDAEARMPELVRLVTGGGVDGADRG
jgi:NTE family protein